jgi:hypothetical protein
MMFPTVQLRRVPGGVEVSTFFCLLIYGLVLSALFLTLIPSFLHCHPSPRPITLLPRKQLSPTPNARILIPTMKDIVKITSDVISLDEVAKSVHDPKAGAISTFSGTTRDNFEGMGGQA